MLNINIPHFYCYMKKEHMYQHKAHIGEFVKVTAFAAQSNPDRAQRLFTIILKPQG